MGFWFMKKNKDQLYNPRKISFSGIDIQLDVNKKKINQSIQKTLERGKFIMGPEVKKLETELSNFCKSKFSITCANGTDAITLALMALDFKSGDYIITPAFGFISTVESPTQLGINPIFVDINKDNFSINIDELKKIIIKAKNEKIKIKGIITADLFGEPANYSELLEVCKESNLLWINDGAQAFGSKYNKKSITLYSDITTTSFFPSKPLGCYGDGGCVFTESEKLPSKISSLKIHGKGENKYDNIFVGLNSRLDSIQASVLLEKLRLFKKEIKRRNEISDFYLKNLCKNIKLPDKQEKSYSVWSQFTIRTKNRDNLKEFLLQKKIPTMIYYPKPLNKQKAYKKFSNFNNSLINCEEACNEVLSIPIHGYMCNSQAEYVAETINNFYKK